MRPLRGPPDGLDPEVFGTGGGTLGDCLLAPEEDAEARTDFNRDVDASLARMRAFTDRLLARLTPRERAILESRFRQP